MSTLNYVVAFPVAQDFDQEMVDKLNYVAAVMVRNDCPTLSEVQTDVVTYDAGEGMIVAKIAFAFNFDGMDVDLAAIMPTRKLAAFLSPANCPVEGWDIDNVPAFEDLHFMDSLSLDDDIYGDGFDGLI